MTLHIPTKDFYSDGFFTWDESARYSPLPKSLLFAWSESLIDVECCFLIDFEAQKLLYCSWKDEVLYFGVWRTNWNSAHISSGVNEPHLVNTSNLFVKFPNRSSSLFAWICELIAGLKLPVIKSMPMSGIQFLRNKKTVCFIEHILY